MSWPCTQWAFTPASFALSTFQLRIIYDAFQCVSIDSRGFLPLCDCSYNCAYKCWRCYWWYAVCQTLFAANCKINSQMKYHKLMDVYIVRWPVRLRGRSSFATGIAHSARRFIFILGTFANYGWKRNCWMLHSGCVRSALRIGLVYLAYECLYEQHGVRIFNSLIYW